jgi:hypothetical protein
VSPLGHALAQLSPVEDLVSVGVQAALIVTIEDRRLQIAALRIPERVPQQKVARLQVC